MSYSYYASAYQIQDLICCGVMRDEAPFYVNALDIIKELGQYEVAIPDSTTAESYFECVLDMLDIDAYDKMDNSYNWNGAVSNHFDFKVVENLGNACFVLIKWHKYGDVRANYTCCALYRFRDLDEFYYTIDNVKPKNKVVIVGQTGDHTVWVEPDPFSEYRVIYWDSGAKEVVVEDLDDLKREIKEGLGN